MADAFSHRLQRNRKSAPPQSHGHRCHLATTAALQIADHGCVTFFRVARKAARPSASGDKRPLRRQGLPAQAEAVSHSARRTWPLTQGPIRPHRTDRHRLSPPVSDHRGQRPLISRLVVRPSTVRMTIMAKRVSKESTVGVNVTVLMMVAAVSTPRPTRKN